MSRTHASEHSHQFPPKERGGLHGPLRFRCTQRSSCPFPMIITISVFVQLGAMDPGNFACTSVVPALVRRSTPWQNMRQLWSGVLLRLAFTHSLIAPRASSILVELPFPYCMTLFLPGCAYKRQRSIRQKRGGLHGLLRIAVRSEFPVRSFCYTRSGYFSRFLGEQSWLRALHARLLEWPWYGGQHSLVIPYASDTGSSPCQRWHHCLYMDALRWFPERLDRSNIGDDFTGAQFLGFAVSRAGVTAWSMIFASDDAVCSFPVCAVDV